MSALHNAAPHQRYPVIPWKAGLSTRAQHSAVESECPQVSREMVDVVPQEAVKEGKGLQ